MKQDTSWSLQFYWSYGCATIELQTLFCCCSCGISGSCNKKLTFVSITAYGAKRKQPMNAHEVAEAIYNMFM